jgi:hypothetical protein
MNSTYETLNLLAAQSAAVLRHNDDPDHGIYVNRQDGSYAGQQWFRDGFMGSLGLPRDSGLTLLTNFLVLQRPEGELPYRIETESHISRYIFGWFTKHLRLRRARRAVYRNSKFAVPATDTVPLAAILAGQVGCSDAHIMQLDRALQYERNQWHCSHRGLHVFPPVSDWMDDLQMPGAHGHGNVLYTAAYRSMYQTCRTRAEGATLTKSQTWRECADRYRSWYHNAHDHVRRHLLDPSYGMVLAGADDDRIDAPSSLTYGILLASKCGARDILTGLELQRSPSGILRNYSRDYDRSQYRGIFQLLGFTQFANAHVYPWVDGMEGMLRGRVARAGSAEDAQALTEFILRNGRLHLTNGDFFEVVDGVTGQPVIHRLLGIPVYRSSPKFSASAGVWHAAAKRLREGLERTQCSLS